MLASREATDFADARRKAASRLGIKLRQAPDNASIELAMQQYRELFQGTDMQQQLDDARRAAFQAMHLLENFDPHLVGPLLTGKVLPEAPIYLHLFADTTEQLALFLHDKNIPFQQTERTVRYTTDERISLPLFRFIAGNTTFELTVFPLHGLRRRPLSPIDNKPMQRADIRAVQQLIAAKPADPGMQATVKQS